MSAHDLLVVLGAAFLVSTRWWLPRAVFRLWLWYRRLGPPS